MIYSQKADGLIAFGNAPRAFPQQARGAPPPLPLGPRLTSVLADTVTFTHTKARGRLRAQPRRGYGTRAAAGLWRR